MTTSKTEEACCISTIRATEKAEIRAKDLVGGKLPATEISTVPGALVGMKNSAIHSGNKTETLKTVKRA